MTYEALLEQLSEGLKAAGLANFSVADSDAAMENIAEPIAKAIIDGMNFEIKGSATVAEINALDDKEAGDTWAVTDGGTIVNDEGDDIEVTAGDLVVWDGLKWGCFFHIDLTGYVKDEDLSEAIATHNSSSSAHGLVGGVLPVSKGGTGKNSINSGNYLVGNGASSLIEKTPKDAGSDVLKSLDVDYGDVVDGDYIVTSYHQNASTISGSLFVRRQASKLWNYIKSKISSVLGLTALSYGGTASKALTAQNYDTSTGTIKAAFANKSDKGHVHNTDANEVTSNDTNLDVVTDTTAFVTTNTNGFSSNDKCLYRRPAGTKLWPWIASKIGSYTGVVHTTGNETVAGEKTFTSQKVVSASSESTYGGFFVQRTYSNSVYEISLEVSSSTGNRGVYDYVTDKWIVYKDSSGVTHVGGASDESSTVRIGKLTIDTSGTIGSASNTLYIG